MLSKKKNIPSWARELVIKPGQGPIFRQIKAWAVKAISENLFSPGDCFPSEIQLAQAAGVSRLTIRQATNELVAEGLLIREQGKRPRVAKAKCVTHFLELGGITHYLDHTGQKYRREVLLAENMVPSEEISRILKVRKGCPVFVLERIRSIDDEKLGWEKTWMNRNLCPGIDKYDFNRDSLYTILSCKYGIVPDHADGTIDVIVANEEHSRLLNLKEGAPLLSVQRTVYDKEGTPLQFNHEIYRGDRYSFAFSVQNRII